MKKRYLFLTVIAAALFSSCSKTESKVESKPVKVTTIVAEAVSVDASVGYPGTIEAESSSTLSFAVAGTVSTLNIEEGQMVGKGQLIGTLDDTSLRSAYEQAKAVTTQAADAHKRMKQLYDAGSLPEIQWVEAQSKLEQAQAAEQMARKSLDDTRLLAPFGGYIAKKQSEVGQNVSAGSAVAELVRIDRVKACVAVPEAEMGLWGNGREVKVGVKALGGRTFTGKVVERGVKADALSRSYEVKVLIGNGDHELLPGMLCEVTVDTPHADGAVALPADIVQIGSDNRPFVWVADDGKAVRTPVVIGGNAGSNVLVSNGLQAGAKVIVAGQQKVSDGTKIVE